jgi:hypothetical protein
MSGPGGPPSEEALLTLEPLIDAVRSGVEGAGWTLSGLQKTTSHQFEGRWQGESTRSAYLFFHFVHSGGGSEDASIDVYLDETSQGLTGNFALVVDLVPLAELGDPSDALRSLGSLAASRLPPEHATPVTLRFRLQTGDADPGAAETEVRFKVRIPRRAVTAGADAVRRLAASAVEGFARILAAPELARYMIAE